MPPIRGAETRAQPRDEKKDEKKAKLRKKADKSFGKGLKKGFFNNPKPINLEYEAMRNLFNGNEIVFLHANSSKQIHDGIVFLSSLKIKNIDSPNTVNLLPFRSSVEYVRM